MIGSITGFAYDYRNASKLVDFYKELLGREKILPGNGWVGLCSPQGWILASQEVKGYEPPVWLWKNGRQQQMAHADSSVENLGSGAARALKYGAKNRNKRQKLRKLYFIYQVVLRDIRQEELNRRQSQTNKLSVL